MTKRVHWKSLEIGDAVSNLFIEDLVFNLFNDNIAYVSDKGVNEDGDFLTFSTINKSGLIMSATLSGLTDSTFSVPKYYKPFTPTSRDSLLAMMEHEGD